MSSLTTAEVGSCFRHSLAVRAGAAPEVPPEPAGAPARIETGTYSATCRVSVTTRLLAIIRGVAGGRQIAARRRLCLTVMIA
jgi:hypothetical protein